MIGSEVKLAPAVQINPGRKAINPGGLGASPQRSHFTATLSTVHNLLNFVSALSLLHLLGSSWRRGRERFEERSLLLLLLLQALLDEIAVLHQLADERIDLLEGEGRLGAPFQVAAYEAIFVHLQFQGRRASLFDGGQAELLGQGEHAQNAAYPQFSLFAVDGLAEGADVSSGACRSRQQLQGTERHALGVILRLDSIPASFLADMLAQELAVVGIEEAHVKLIPLYVHHPPDPAGRRAVVGGLDLHAAVQMHGALAV